ncbi:hypothetical protein GLOTRDRAFT_139471 [Gloeophyllum trabeum ATCC 11539]|uniref:Ser-Thr-rich glycosyl-phosphatidyl-inositol-anchored membrane family-domain-containing protein n=1 Tax=Gloeophyllum trabeum (strain ATCC 11539 / FP-39264 / Madison 617) TaxID=670483 RepID=S7RMY2_GLOTA|nr:uncharacterized protein GLOTRDRAFT_139471 [Gloeophyllum trabeum ATCC 11539]EPQ54064.1 hypothetical protein GLOTRDRAFT_139471 [Gloeophyllum trabeum ATCC 11539]
MKFFATAAALVALVPAVLGLTVNTPTNVVACQPIQFTWADGTAPYFLSLVPGGQPSATAIQQFPTQQGTSFSWSQVTLAPNTAFTIVLKDSTGAQAFSDIVTVQSGSDLSCLNGSTSASVTGGASTTGGSSPSGTTSGGSSPTSTSPSGGNSSSNRPTGSSSGSSASPTNSSGASRGQAVSAFGVAGVMGLVGAALF